MKRKLSIAVAFVVPLFIANLSAQQPETHRHDPAENLGQVNFKVSCSLEASREFNRAVAWLHSFEYEEAEKRFTEIAGKDPQCAMAYWGIAMSNYHPLWAAPTAAELQKGAEAIDRAKEIGGRSQRETDYIEALATFYRDADKLDHRARAFAYHEAMKRVYQANQSDREAAVFYALTLIATGAMSNDKKYDKEREAAKILNGVLVKEPQHPGVAHYLIHSYDYPALARLALPAARSYAKIAPASAHAQHMPSHIFIRLGLWQEAIKSNLDARASANAFAQRHHLPGAWDEELHAMDYLVYAYLQSAQDRQALSVLDDLNSMRQVNPPSFKVAYSATAIPARYALERRQWKEAVELSLHPDGLETFPWSNFRWAEAHIRFARAIGAVHLGDVATARKEIEELTNIRAALGERKTDYDWARQVEIKRQVAAAWLEFVEGNKVEALRLMSAAADLDDATEKHPVTPGQLLPAREQLAELLLELNQASRALQEFETSLQSAPNRFSGLYGAARAAKVAGDQDRARSYYEKLVTISRAADTSRPELEEAKAFLAKAAGSARR